MPPVIVSDYFYGDESKEFSYFRIPRLLISHARFKNVSVEAKLLYGLLLDRMGLSSEHGWYDEDGRVFIYYTVEEIADDLCCGRDKAMKLLAELDRVKGAGLIERVRQGQGKPTKIYVKRFTTRELPPKKEEPPAPISEVEILDVQKSEIPTSRSLENRLPEVEKSDPSYIDYNYPDLSYPDPSIYPKTVPRMGWIERCDFTERVKNQIGYASISAFAADTAARKATDFHDYDPTAWYAKAVEAAVDNGLLIRKAVHRCLRKSFCRSVKISLLIDPEELPDMPADQLHDFRLPVRFPVAEIDPCGNGQA